MKYIAFDSHKRYTFASVKDQESGEVTDKRVEHERGALTNFLSRYETVCPVAVEKLGSWYWSLEEIEATEMEPKLVHARQAKMMLASSKNTDKLDTHGMNKLQWAGALPTVWIPEGDLCDNCSKNSSSLAESTPTKATLTKMFSSNPPGRPGSHGPLPGSSSLSSIISDSVGNLGATGHMKGGLIACSEPSERQQR